MAGRTFHDPNTGFSTTQTDHISKGIMVSDTHNFIHDYQGIGAFGLDRENDEKTVKFYLQKFSEDTFMEKFIPRLSNKELTEIYEFINTRLKQHISEEEYHALFLKDR